MHCEQKLTSSKRGRSSFGKWITENDIEGSNSVRSSHETSNVWCSSGPETLKYRSSSCFIWHSSMYVRKHALLKISAKRGSVGQLYIKWMDRRKKKGTKAPTDMLQVEAALGYSIEVNQPSHFHIRSRNVRATTNNASVKKSMQCCDVVVSLFHLFHQTFIWKTEKSGGIYTRPRGRVAPLRRTKYRTRVINKAGGRKWMPPADDR